ncbi:MAG: hypothetical protein RLZZ383_2099 [Pseudomonadota bacterium]
MSAIDVAWLGRRPYREVWDAQRERRDGLLAGHAAEALWLLEHPRVVTRGRRGGWVDAATLAAAGVDVVDIERGGLATVHAPGQLVGYVLVDLGRRGWGPRVLVDRLESALIEVARGYGVDAERRCGAPGVWVQTPTGGRKVGAIGLFVRRGVTMHGFSLNLHLAPDAFVGIDPCGFEAGVSANLSDFAAGVPSVQDAWPTVADVVARALHVGALDTPAGSVKCGASEGM